MLESERPREPHLTRWWPGTAALNLADSDSPSIRALR